MSNFESKDSSLIKSSNNNNFNNFVSNLDDEQRKIILKKIKEDIQKASDGEKILLLFFCIRNILCSKNKEELIPKDKKTLYDLCDLVLKDIDKNYLTISLPLLINNIIENYDESYGHELFSCLRDCIINTQKEEYKKEKKDDFLEIDIDEWKKKYNGAKNDCHHQILFSEYGITIWKVMNCSRNCALHYHEYYSLTVFPKNENKKEVKNKLGKESKGPNYINDRRPKFIEIMDNENYVMFMLGPDPPHSVDGTLSEGTKSTLAFYRIEFGEYK